MTELTQPYDISETGGESASTWTFDKFSEPRTMPSHWNLSEIMASPEAAGENVSKPSQQAGLPDAEMLPFDPESVDAVSPEWHLNPFPEPRTYPTQWDLYT